MDVLSSSLLLAAAGVGLVHTLLGPDHYLPFVTLARARRWSLARTLTITGLCGTGHVLGSIALGAVGVGLGAAVGQIERVEGGRGYVAAWLLVAFGLAYGAWGIRKGLRARGGFEPHEHHGPVHIHGAGSLPHTHEHDVNDSRTAFWTLFIVFVLGPCEPLIPLFVLPASRGHWGLAVATALIFGVVTLATMLAVTALALAGLSRLPWRRLERWSHAMAGGAVAACGTAVIVFGL